MIIERVETLRILDFDIENRPIAYLGPEYTTAEITAIAACFVGEPSSMKVWLLGRDSPVMMLAEFVEMYNKADIVTGHYIREHDLPVINGALMEYSLPPLDQKMTSDTKIDLVRAKYLSKSLENLATMLGLPRGKVHMNNAEWREANRLTPEGLRLTELRAKSDVLLHMRIRKILIARGLLGSAKVWRP